MLNFIIIPSLNRSLCHIFNYTLSRSVIQVLDHSISVHSLYWSPTSSLSYTVTQSDAKSPNFSLCCFIAQSLVPLINHTVSHLHSQFFNLLRSDNLNHSITHLLTSLSNSSVTHSCGNSMTLSFSRSIALFMAQSHPQLPTHSCNYSSAQWVRTD